MRMRILLALAAAAAMTPAAALAQNNTIGGAVGGAAVGGVVGGPVGAAVGAAVGGTVGAATEPPPPVITYVEKHPVPAATVETEIIVGKPLPRTVKLHVIPEHKTYQYAVVNNQRVIVDPKTRTVVKIIK